MTGDTRKEFQMGADAELEAALRRTLRREEAPAGFAERVLAEAARRERTAAITAPTRVPRALPGLRFAIAAMLLLGVTLGIQQHERRQEQARGEAARQQVLLALRITGNRLHRAQMHVSQMQADGAQN
jgi:hypothetical protein